MTELLKQVFEKLNKLHEEEQDEYARLIFDELKWEKSFDESADHLSYLANEAFREYKSGKTKPFEDL